MGTLAFISSLVSSLAWPAAAITLGLLFRRQLREMLVGLAGRMKHLVGLKAAGAEFSFSEQVFAARAEFDETVLQVGSPGSLLASQNPPPTEPADDDETKARAAQILADLRQYLPTSSSLVLGDERAEFTPGNLENLAEQADASPRLTVTLAWSYLSVVINVLFHRLGTSRSALLRPDAGEDERTIAMADAVIAEMRARGATSIPDSLGALVRRLTRMWHALPYENHEIAKLTVVR